MKKEALTDRQAETLQFIKGFYKKNGYMPTYAEIAAGMGINDSVVYVTVKRIAAKGWIRQDRRPRRIEVL